MSTHLDPCVLVLFGATGDLTRRKLTPALYALHCDGHLPVGFQVVAYGRRDKDDASFRADLLAHMQQFAPKAEMSKWDEFAANCFYVRGEFDVQSDYDGLAARLSDLD
ncbi:MAG: glucose-6-phosphate dehydrogenase, partial [Armatimonadaceae bacterium]